MNRYLSVVISLVAALAALVAFILYGAEVKKSNVLRAESSKTVLEAQEEIKGLREENKKILDRGLEDKQKILIQLEQFSREKDAALKDKQEMQKRLAHEEEISLTANDDLNKLRSENTRLEKELKEKTSRLEAAFSNKRKAYDTRILSLEAQLDKARSRLNSEAERYHYNLGVLYTQDKNYEDAVTEFKKALGYNPNSAQAHYNLGIIYDDYFKDKENARYHYRTFLDLQPTSDDAESVREWLKDLDK